MKENKAQQYKIFKNVQCVSIEKSSPSLNKNILKFVVNLFLVLGRVIWYALTKLFHLFWEGLYPALVLMVETIVISSFYVSWKNEKLKNTCALKLRDFFVLKFKYCLQVSQNQFALKRRRNTCMHFRWLSIYLSYIVS